MPGKRGHPYRVSNDPSSRELKVKLTDTEYCRLKAAGQIENKSMSEIVRDQLRKHYAGYSVSKTDELNKLTCKFYEEGE